MGKSAPTLDDIFSELERRRAKETTDGRPGPDWFSYQEYATHYGMSVKAAMYWLDKDFRAGRVEKKMSGRQMWCRLKTPDSASTPAESV
jgi:hypothetical protein